MKAPIDLSGKRVIENAVGGVITVVVVGVGLGAWSRLRKDDWPSTSQAAAYTLGALVVFVAGAVLVHILRWRQSQHTPRLREAIRARADATVEPPGPPPKFEVSHERLNVPLEMLNDAYWTGVSNRSFVSASVMRVTVRPHLAQSLRGGTLELDPQGQRPFLVVGILDSAGMRPIDRRSSHRVQSTLPTLLPGDSATVTLLVLDSLGLEPAFRWFVSTAEGVELDAGNYTFRDYINARNGIH